MKMRPIHNEYLRQKEHQDRIAISGERKIDMLKQRTDFISQIPDMRDAYQQVQDFDYKPTQQEIEFRNFVTGCGYNARRNK